MHRQFSRFQSFDLAFAIFMVLRGINRLRNEEEEAPSEPPRQEVLFEEIRDALVKK